MDGLLNLLPLYTESLEGEHNLGQYLETCRTHQSFGQVGANEKDLNHVVSVINSKLNTTEYRLLFIFIQLFLCKIYLSTLCRGEGTLLLDVLVTQCGTDIFTTNCVSWTQQVMRLLNGPTKISTSPIACRVLGEYMSVKQYTPINTTFELCREVTCILISVSRSLSPTEHYSNFTTSNLALWTRLPAKGTDLFYIQVEIPN